MVDRVSLFVSVIVAMTAIYTWKRHSTAVLNNSVASIRV